MTKGLYEKLSRVQKGLKAPKAQYNSFGNFNYRSCEDILEAVKPLLVDERLVLTLCDKLEHIGDRYYVKAVATVLDVDSEGEISVSAYAREAEEKKGMDDSQVTGTASSYARKYALNALFLIDDTKDADTDEYRGTKKEQKKPSKPEPTKKREETRGLQRASEIISNMQRKLLFDSGTEEVVKRVVNQYGYQGTGNIKQEDFNAILHEIRTQMDNAQRSA
ncbi:MAG TPA: ERF family protein [Tepidimicrobium sp.]|nr:ERF family protein [Tepidimicrobium sp.]